MWAKPHSNWQLDKSQNKKHFCASVKERLQTLLVPSEEICKRVLCKNIFKTPSIIWNRKNLIVRREHVFFKFHTFFGFVYHDLKQKIK